MTVKDMLKLYQSWINDYERKRRRNANEGNSPEADAFFAGAITGFNNAYILLQKHEEEGLEPSKEEKVLQSKRPLIFVESGLVPVQRKGSVKK